LPAENPYPKVVRMRRLMNSDIRDPTVPMPMTPVTVVTSIASGLESVAESVTVAVAEVSSGGNADEGGDEDLC